MDMTLLTGLVRIATPNEVRSRSDTDSIYVKGLPAYPNTSPKKAFGVG